MSGLDIASFVIDCVGLVLAIIALVVAYAAWSAEFKNRRWHQAHERLLKWNEEVLVTTEKTLAHPNALVEVRSRPVFDARLRIYARQQSSRDVETVFLNPVYRTPGANSYQSGVLKDIGRHMSVVAMQWPYANGYEVQVDRVGAPLLNSDQEVRLKLGHLRERCGVFDRFTRQHPEPMRLRIAWKMFSSWKEVREYRNRNRTDTSKVREASYDLWLG